MSEAWWWEPRAATRALKALSRSQLCQAALKVLAQLRQRSCATESHHNVVIDTLRSAQRWPEVLYFLESMRSDGLNLDVTSFNSAMTWHLSFQLLEKMRGEELRADDISFNSVTLSARHSWALTLWCLEAKRDF